MRRDIFDPANVRHFATHTPSQAHLRMLTLMTYADIKAVIAWVLPHSSATLISIPIS